MRCSLHFLFLGLLFFSLFPFHRGTAGNPARYNGKSLDLKLRALLVAAPCWDHEELVCRKLASMEQLLSDSINLDADPRRRNENVCLHLTRQSWLNLRFAAQCFGLRCLLHYLPAY